MVENKSENCFDKKAILDDLIKIITEITFGWEIQFKGSIGPKTLLGADLAFKSLDLVRLVSAIQQLYSHKYIAFQELFQSGDGVIQDLRVSNLVDFLHKHLNNA